MAILGYKAGTLGKMLWAPGQVCLRVIGSVKQVEPAGERQGLAVAKEIVSCPRNSILHA